MPNRAQPIPEDASSYISERLERVLPDGLRTILARASRLAAERGGAAYLVGGYVRDVLLGLPDYDVDVSIVGDATTVAALLAGSEAGAVETHGRFGTATLALLGLRYYLDLVTARRETYDHPGALPTVVPGTIEDDLARRDFTANALAVPLVDGDFGEMLDPHQGLDDIRAGLIRVLHDSSFLDDPTRVMRAVRLSRRLGFAIETRTQSLLEQAIQSGALETVSTERLSHELLLVLETPGANALLHDLEVLGVLRALHADLAWDFAPGELPVRDSAALAGHERKDAYLAALAVRFASEPERAENLARGLRLDASDIKLVRASAELAGRLPALGGEALRPSEIYGLLSDLDLRAVQASLRLRGAPGDARRNRALDGVRRYLDLYRQVKPAVAGEFLRSLGVPPGPVYRELLSELRRAKLDGKLPTPADEQRWVADRLREKRLLPP